MMKHFFISETSPILNGSAFEHTRKAKIKLVSKEKYSEESPLNQDFLGNVVEIPTTKSKKNTKMKKKTPNASRFFFWDRPILSTIWQGILEQKIKMKILIEKKCSA